MNNHLIAISTNSLKQGDLIAYSIYKGDFAVLNQHIYNIKIKDDNFPKMFVYYVLKLHLNYLRSILGGGVGQFHLKKSEVEQIAVIDPPMALKQRFLSVLEKLKVIEAMQNNSSNQINELYNSLMLKAFKGELVTEVRSQSQVTEHKNYHIVDSMSK